MLPLDALATAFTLGAVAAFCLITLIIFRTPR